MLDIDVVHALVIEKMNERVFGEIYVKKVIGEKSILLIASIAFSAILLLLLLLLLLLSIDK